MDAGVPAQSQLIGQIFKIPNDEMSDILRRKRDGFREVLESEFCLSREQQEHVPLEDIFTPIDRCLLDQVSFRNLHRNAMLTLRQDIYHLIGEVIDHSGSHEKRSYIQKFASDLVRRSKIRLDINHVGCKDPVAVISTNWDIILDRALKNAVHLHNQDVEQTRHINGLYGKGVVDYCCYISSFDEDDHSIKPGLEALGAGGFNVKLLKLHGSLNWLQCPICSRIYVSFDDKISIKHIEDEVRCRHCEKNYGKVAKGNGLNSNVVMPTFLKSFVKAQYKLIWDNAAVELSEASKIVFIGYSLPQADFEMRQLLSRMVRKNAKIEVVSKDGSEFEDLKKRYRLFFGVRDIDFHGDGAAAYIDALCI